MNSEICDTSPFKHDIPMTMAQSPSEEPINPKPKRMEVQWDEIPTGLSKNNCWVVWKWDWNEKKGDWDKPPYQINGRRASSTNPDTWAAYGEVFQAYQTRKWDGIGYVIGNGYTGIDWDDIRNPVTGDFHQHYHALIKKFDSYTEVSPSGGGAKTLIKGKVPATGHHDENVGVFSSGRYFCITGNRLPECSKNIEPRQDQLDELVRNRWPNDFKQKESHTLTTINHNFTDSDIIQKALNSKDTKFHQLWSGDISGYASHSEADQALCNKLAFWSGKDSTTIGSLFRESGLMRDKWNRDDYRERTISKAIEATTETYHARETSFYSKPSKGPQVEGHSFGSIEPVDIFGDTILTGKPEWPDDACPATIINFARDEAERIGVDIEMIAIPSITCTAIAISDKFKIQPKQHDTRWTESARLWTMVVAESGQKKTPCFKAAFEPLKEIEKDFYFQHKEDVAEYNRQKQLYDAEKKAAVKDCDLLQTEEPQKPVQTRYLADDITIEALRRVLEHNDNGIGVIKDELSGWINSFDVYRSSKQGSKDRADYCELYQGGNKNFDRAEKGFIFVSNWSASIMGFIQPGPVKRNFGNVTDDGMLARFLVCHGRRQGRGVDRKPDYTVINAYRGLIKNLSELRPKDGESEIFKFSPEAMKYREAIYTTCEHVQVLPNSSEALKAHLSKWEAAFCRIVLVYHIIEAVAVGQSPGPLVTENTARMAATLMIEFLLPNSARFYNDTIDDGENGSHARWVAGYILSNHLETIGSRDVQRSYKPLKNDRKEISRTMETLELAGWVIPGNTKRDGKITNWAVNPKVHIVFAKRAKEESARRDAEKVKIQRAIKAFQAKG